jgi:sugar lactone lactonase YvrE
VTGLVPEPVAVPGLELGEGPCWDAASQALYWVDTAPGLVYRLGASGPPAASWPAGMPVGAVFPRAAGGLVVPARDGVLGLDPVSGAVSVVAPVEADKPWNKMNDGACDQAGRLFVGTMAADESPGQGALYRLDPDLSLTVLATGVGISNGIGWSPDNQLMYYCDSLAYRVDVFDYDPATGEVAGRREFAAIGAGECMPDGLAVDAEGGVWVAHWGGGVLCRYLPDGQLDRTVKLPHAHVTSCAFAGPGLDRLYITTAAGPADPRGGLFVLEPGVTGLPSYPFGG